MNKSKQLKRIKTLFFITINPNKSITTIKKIGITFLRGFERIYNEFSDKSRVQKYIKGNEYVRLLSIKQGNEIGSKQHRLHVHITLIFDCNCRMDYTKMREFINIFYPRSHIKIIRKIDELAAIEFYTEKEAGSITKVLQYDEKKESSQKETNI